MPTTPTFAIPYPCSGDTIDPTVIADWTNGIDAALANVSASSELALNRPSLSMNTDDAGQSFATGVAANFTYTTVDFIGGITAVVPTTTATIVRAGVYHVVAQATHTNQVTSITQFRLIVNASTGRRVSRNLGTPFVVGPPTFGAAVLAEGLFVCPVGTTLSANFLWTGTGGPLTSYGSMWINMVSEL